MRSIWLEGYRCFGERQEARLAPLTLLVGDNSTGKTSFLAMIRALWDVAYRNRVPNFKEEPYDLGSFDEVAHFRGVRGGRAQSFQAGFALRPIPNRAVRGLSSPTNRASRFGTMFSRRGTVPVLATRELANESGDLGIEHRQEPARVLLRTPSGRWCLDLPRGISVEGDLLFPLTLSWHMASRGEGATETEPTERDHQAIRDLARSVSTRTARRLYASAPVRSKPHRTYDPSLVARDPEGDYVPMFLAHRHSEGGKLWDELVAAIVHFGQDAGLFDEVTVKPLAKRGGPFQLQIRRFDGRTKGPQRNLIDVGYGVSQVLPVVTELLRQDAPTMFLLQQPEVHLHPSAQAALGSLFCRTASWDRQLVVETHSDHLLDRVRMDVRDGAASLRPEDVSILYFERRGLDVRIHSLRIDDEGNILDAPPGYRQFFMAEVSRSLWKQEAGG